MTGQMRFKKRLGDDGEWVDATEYLLDGRVVTEAAYKAAFPEQEILPGQVLAAPSTSGWPMTSNAMAVHHKQIALARKMDRDRGAPPTEYTKAGQPVFVSERHKRAFIRAHGVHDRNSYS